MTKILKRLSLILLLVLATLLLGLWIWLRSSLPLLEGQQAVDGLDDEVQVLRDAQGLLTLNGASTTDIAFALGFVHAQERFFQMDLQRRRAAGTLGELFGTRALKADQNARLHRFTFRSQRNYQMATPEVRHQLRAYSRGVNAGLEALGARPFEYGLLQQRPAPWKPEDSYLTLFSMFLVLQDDQARFERGLALMADTLPSDLFEFFSQQGGNWDAPLNGGAFHHAPLPENGWADVLDGDLDLSHWRPEIETPLPGSNNWAVSGDLTEHGGALVADDMHLPLRVPNIWYRAAWKIGAQGSLISGVTLPGVPLMVAGSNGAVAWGFTNTQGDWSDVVVLETDADQQRYRSKEGWVEFELIEETIELKDQEPVSFTVRETQWGPVIGTDHHGRLLALRWVAHDPEGANFNLAALESARTVHDLVAVASGLGIPHQNLVMGDHQGNIAWTIAGAIPRRLGTDGRLPMSWHTGQARWDGYYGPAEHPSIVNPASGRLWTANARVVSGDMLEKMGSQGSALGARQGQIRDRLMELERADEADMLAIQLDDEARFLQRWRIRLLGLLQETRGDNDTDLKIALSAVENWSGRAASHDPGYRLVREWRLAVLERILAPLEAHLNRFEEGFRLRSVSRQMEYPGWTLLQEQPHHLLNPAFDGWEALELDALRQVLNPKLQDGTLDNDGWGEANQLQIQHPLASAVPLIGAWLTMTSVPMDGDTHMPRVQSSSFGASERFAVSPGREQQGYLHMATGQSGHPLSPFFDAGHEDWVEGRASSWLPGVTRYELTLTPRP